MVANDKIVKNKEPIKLVKSLDFSKKFDDVNKDRLNGYPLQGVDY